MPVAYRDVPYSTVFQRRTDQSTSSRRTYWRAGVGSPPPRNAPGLLDPLVHLSSLSLLQRRDLDVAAPIGVPERRRRAEFSATKKTTFTETS